MWFLGRRYGRVTRLVLEHLSCVRTTVDLFVEGTRAYLSEGDWAEATELASRTRRAEGHADDVRRGVLKTLVKGVLLPPSRRQILELTERVDVLANASESALDYLVEQRVELPDDIRQALLGILEVTEGIFDHVESAIGALFSRGSAETLAEVERIEKAEGSVDRLERDLIKHMFKSEFSLAQKLHILGYLERLSEISDRAEDSSDRIALTVAEGAF